MRIVAGGLMLLLSACAGGIVPPAPAPVRPAPVAIAPKPTPPKPVAPPASIPPTANAVKAGVVAGPEVATLAISPEAASRALAAFRLSCPAIQRRNDLSGLTRGADWTAACSAASTATDARAFFAAQFETVRVGTGQAFATGYYEPEIAGSRTRDAANQVPVYGKPADLVELDLGDFAEGLKNKTIRGRISGGTFVPYFDRTQIEEGALAGRGLEIAWAADPIEFFFLQVQGSGRLRLPDGSVMRIGYNSQNGRDYTGIGALMRDRGLVGPGQLSMQGIMAWLRAHPEEGRAIMRENKSWVFFRELTGAGPIGALSVAVAARTSVAADPAFIPLGAPVWLDLDRAEADGLWVAQDTGGAIKGANRVDTFWGAGEEARRIAGGMSGRGSALILVPRGTLARLNADAARPQP
ncbi:murein transglycosylase A [Sphingomonas sp. SUN039]|uniref:murein transglycosylase A n=1 Tax=Sphingomonas sp. SUN039 TaxID=2937787 RepID=UPI002164CDE9|nr:murein transglycosylase A [Sphingomonas sp. SUN039]UVO53030.1 murein transglycosylase A [Sphingomonas sp. SUN039]